MASDLADIRKSCNLLTDDDLIQIKNSPVSKRAKGMKRFVKQICEELEFNVWNNGPYDEKYKDDFFKLTWIEQSFIEKIRFGDQNPGLLKKIDMGFDTLTSKKRLSIEIKKGQEMPIPKNSFFWREWASDVPMHKRFNQLAKEKKIKTKDHMVMIFDGFSPSGSAPKIKAKDSDLDNEWSIKWGDEIHSDVVGSRIFAALGFDVDHPYYRSANELTLIIPDDLSEKKLIEEIWKNFKINISDYISQVGVVTKEMIDEIDELKPYENKKYIRFIECAIEGRPDRVKRLGPMVTKKFDFADNAELRASLLVHLWINNWDTRSGNTLLAINHEGNFKYHLSGVFSDLGTSFGVHLTPFPVDFRVGLPNSFSWDLVTSNSKKIEFNSPINSILSFYNLASYVELKWMATEMAKITEETLTEILDKSGWPAPIKTLYLHKLASRRAQILKAFEIKDLNPIEFDRHLTIEKDGKVIVKDGELVFDYKSKNHPIGYLSEKGRFSNYGGKKP